MRRPITLLSLLGLLAPLLLVAPAAAQTSATFTDIGGNVHQDNIERLAELGITRGCAEDRFCPEEPVTRQEMATFLSRALGLPVPSSDTRFTDVVNRTHSGNVEALAREGIVAGATGTCRVRDEDDDEPTSPYFCPQDPVNRNQMALFLQGAFAFGDADPRGLDDVASGAFHTPAIGSIVDVGVTRGCGSGGRYCGTDRVTRGQMASFLMRALDITGTGEACPSGTAASTVGALATQGFPINSAEVDHDRDLMYLFTNGLSPQRLVVARLSDGTVLHNHVVPGAGTRVWATTTADERLYFGRWGTGNGQNFYRIALDALEGTPSSSDWQTIGQAGLGDGTPLDNRITGQTQREFWALTSDDQDRVYAGTGAQDTVYRFTPPETTGGTTGVVEKVALANMPRVPSGSKREVTALSWTPNGLVVGTGRGQGVARVVAPDLLDEEVDTGTGSVETSWSTTPLWDPNTSSRQVFGIYGMSYVPGEGGTPDRVVMTTEEDRAALASVALAGDGTVPTSGDVRARQTPATPGTAGQPEPILSKPTIGPSGEPVAVGFSSARLYELTGSLTTSPTLVARTAPVPADFSRRLTFDGQGGLAGATAGGRLWYRDTAASTATTVRELVRSGLVSVGPERPQSLTAVRSGTTRYAVVGGNNKATVHTLAADRRDGSTRTTDVRVPGEAKAMTTVGATAYAATYPGAELRAIPLPSSDADIPEAADAIVSWNDLYNRPRDIAHDAFNGRLVIGAKADFGDYGAIISVRTNGTGLREWPLDDVLPGPASNDPFTVAVGPDGTAIIGDRLGHLIGFDHLQGRKRWEVKVGSRPITGITVTEDGLIHAQDDRGLRSTVVDGRNGVWTMPAQSNWPLLTSGAGAGGELREVGGLLVGASEHRTASGDRATGATRRLSEGLRPATFTTRPMLAAVPGGTCNDVLTLRAESSNGGPARIHRGAVTRP